MRSSRLVILIVSLSCLSCTGGDEAEAPDQTLWRNGNFGTWTHDNGSTSDVVGQLYSGTGISNVAVVDDVSGGTPSLQMTCSSTATCRLAFSTDGLTGPGPAETDMTRYKNGHLRFDLKMLVSDATAVDVTLFPSLTVAIPPASLTTSGFTAISLALTPDLFGTDGPQALDLVFEIHPTLSTTTSNRPILVLNDVRWTAD